jgi:hypothetical protein
VVIGIGSSIYFIRDYFEPHIDYEGQLDSLNAIIAQKEAKISDLSNDIIKAEQSTNQYKIQWEKAKKDLALQKAANQNQDKVKELPLDEMVKYILEYYDTDSTSAKITQVDSVTLISVTPKLINNVGNTIAELRDNLELLEAYEVSLTLADSLIVKQELNIGLLNDKVKQLESVNNDYKNKDAVNNGVIEGKDAEIKKYKFQRNVAGAGAIIIFIIALL